MVKAWGLTPEQVLFVGDSMDDLKCGIAAGMKTVLFDPETKRPQLHSMASIVVKSMAELQSHLTTGVKVRSFSFRVSNAVRTPSSSRALVQVV